ncbi:monoterpene epsilon-lactone hydrolase [Pseudarthrobacter defluvii]|uniref:alpha/beta hydrolase fold domain-containing protein n=1 Tax=Pseudarthrobacter defluvii TaxID=410837 RepID=UPI002789D910|nr:alpha/beta hydrolase [Pseudarthrobacter defluvii]MDQ0769439.1 monoterpene epsilon-lactone hydrolase [Pseudarthrobacter defluvii]
MSLRMGLIAAYLRLTAKPKMVTAQRARRRMAEPPGPSAPPQKVRERHNVTCRRVNGFECWTVTPRTGGDRAAMYLHGGAYISEIAQQHWELVSAMADAGVRVEVPIYGLAPQYTYRHAYPFLTQVYRDLVAVAGPSAVAIAGDSAGAALALGLTQSLSEAGLPAPSRMILISPWLDLTLNGQGVAEADTRDPWLSRAGLIEAGAAWAGGDDPTQPRLSPINGPMSALPPTDVYIGTRDLFLPDVRRFARIAAQSGAPVTVQECAGAVHVYPLVPAPEGRLATQRIIASIACPVWSHRQPTSLDDRSLRRSYVDRPTHLAERQPMTTAGHTAMSQYRQLRSSTGWLVRRTLIGVRLFGTIVRSP